MKTLQGILWIGVMVSFASRITSTVYVSCHPLLKHCLIDFNLLQGGGVQSLPSIILVQESMLDFHSISIAEKILEAGLVQLILFWHKMSQLMIL